MTDTKPLQAELTKIDRAIAAQEELRGILDDAQLTTTLTALQDRRTALVAQLTRDGATAQGAGATALGARAAKAERVGGHLVTGDHNVINPDPAQAAAERARQRYLQRVQQQCNVLPLAAMGGEEGVNDDISLDQVYVALDTTTPIPLTAAEKAARKTTTSVLGTRDDTRPLTALEAATQERRLALLGDPGGGKSTCVRQWAARVAAATLAGVAPFPGWEVGLVPVLVTLRELAPELAAVELKGCSEAEQERRLVTTVRAHLAAQLRACKATEWDTCLEDLLLAGDVLLVLDGLDEVAESCRGRVRRAVGALLREYSAIKRTIVTCRVRSYVGAAVLPGFTAHTLAPFDEEKIAAFVAGWYQAQHHLGRLTAAVAEERTRDLRQAAQSGDLRPLARNPMLLTTMALIHQREVGLPKERVRLYALAVQVLLTRWQQRKGVAASPELAAVLGDELKLRALLERLAYEAHRRQAGRSRGGDLARKDLLEILEDRAYLGAVGLAGEFLDYVDQRAGLLVGQGGDDDGRAPKTYAFPHRTFQEYLAGCYLVSGRSAEREYWQQTEQGEAWALAALLGAEELYYNRRNTEKVLDLAYALGPEHEPETRREWQALLWSGQMAALVGAETITQDTARPDGGAAYLTRLTRRLVMGLAESPLTAAGRAELGNALGKVGDPRAGVGVDAAGVPDIIWCEVSAGPFRLGSDREKDGQADSNELPQQEVTLPGYWISQYPVTQAQYGAFVAAGGYAEARYWTEAGWQWREQGDITGPRKHDEPFNLPNHPVVGVSWYEAAAFCRWLTERLRDCADAQIRSFADSPFVIRLPREAEWEKAARGPDGRVYPWGNEVDPERANYEETGIGVTSAVGAFPGGASPYGVLDLSGNVLEWTGSHFQKYPYDSQDGREEPAGTGPRVLRGGSFFDLTWFVRCAYRDDYSPFYRSYNLGFRLVLAPLAL